MKRTKHTYRIEVEYNPQSVRWEATLTDESGVYHVGVGGTEDIAMERALKNFQMWAWGAIQSPIQDFECDEKDLAVC